jgi:hypothetical protein
LEREPERHCSQQREFSDAVQLLLPIASTAGWTGLAAEDKPVLRLLTSSSVLLLLAGLTAAPAAPPAGADPNSPIGQWFQSLKQPGSGVSCCSVADCRPVDYRIGAEGYEAMLDGSWVHVPDQRVLRNQANPTARAVLCRSPISGAILCFVPASEA